MKSLPIISRNFVSILEQYSKWLKLLDFAEPTLISFPLYIREFLHFLEQKGVTHISDTTNSLLDDFVRYFRTRVNQRTGGAISISHINNCAAALNNWGSFLNASGMIVMDIGIEYLEDYAEEQTILNKEEIARLYVATFTKTRQNPFVYGLRDRAMLAVLYGCGLRRSEARSLNIEDINLAHRLLLVRNGKNRSQRYVPIPQKHASDIEQYLEEGRSWFLYFHNGFLRDRNVQVQLRKPQADTSAFFVSFNGTRLSDFYKRLDHLRRVAGIEKQFSPHTLRHSIATHLLLSGMPIDAIGKFLGHRSLSSTQIYTHIVPTNINYDDLQKQEAGFLIP